MNLKISEIKKLELKLINKRHYFTRGFLLTYGLLIIVSLLTIFLNYFHDFWWWYINLFIEIDIESSVSEGEVYATISLGDWLTLLPILILSIFIIGWGFKKVKPKTSQFIKGFAGILFGLYAFFFQTLIGAYTLGITLIRHVDLVDVLMALLEQYIGTFFGSFL